MVDNSTTLGERIESLMSSLTASERRIAKLIIDNPSGVSMMTISDLSSRAGTSESTVVRTARTLGFSGYPELRLALAAAGAATPTNDRPTLTGDIHRDDSLEVALEKLATAEVAALRSTASQVDLTALQTVVDAIATARRVDIYGIGASGLVGADFWQKLMRIGRDCHVFEEAHIARVSASLLSPGDLALAISHSGEITDVLDAIRLAKDLGATTVAITSQVKSPLARLVDHVLLTSARKEPLHPGAMASRMSQLLLTDAIFVGVAQRDYDASIRALRHTTAAVDSRRLRTRSSRS